ncbi:hypothetical protein HOD19_02445 [bacterium]|jgi:hypothetical protein|nr:hypothetical protein [bacterium]MBT4649188.1 hypothetical protein [bacterium]
MNWDKMTPRSVVFGLLVASWSYLMFSLPLPESISVSARMINFHQHMTIPFFFLVWFSYANLWILIRFPGAPLGAALSIMLGGILSVALGMVLGLILDGMLGGILGLILGFIMGVVLGLILGNATETTRKGNEVH